MMPAALIWSKLLARVSRKVKADASPRAWQRMLSGRRLDLLNPSPLDIEISDIAHGLARVARWNGQTAGDQAFSVAQHSLVVEDFALRLKPGLPVKWRLAALLHDAPEYVIGDLISPFKAALSLDYKAFEHRLLDAIHIRFGIPAHLPEAITATIKKADRISAYFEARLLAGFDAEEAGRYFGPVGDFTPPDLTPMPATEAGAQFLDRFERLCALMAKGDA